MGMSTPDHKSPESPPADPGAAVLALGAPLPVSAPPRELGGSAGPEPTRFGDWEKNGRCIDF
jgi:Protein of unknown function (DUF1674)